MFPYFVTGSMKLLANCKSIYTQEQGYQVAVSSAPYSVRGTVALTSADNLASNALGGFKESASALRHCRQCLGCADETATKVSLILSDNMC